MRRLMNEHGAIASKLVVSLGRRMRIANERLTRQSFQTVQSRVAIVLGDLVTQARLEGAGGNGNGDDPVELTITQADIAQLAGCSRESASRFLTTLANSGAIEQGRGRIKVLDTDLLTGFIY
jgi:CRP/FNR family transcriptional regulator